MSSGTIDTRVLGKPTKYGGDREQWVSWKFVFKSYIGALDSRLLTDLEIAEVQREPLLLTDLPEAAQGRARLLTYVLSQTLTGAPLLMLMNTESHNGLEAWRRMVAKEEPCQGSAQVNQLTAILRATFTGKLESYLEEMERFEASVLSYSRMHGEELADSLHQALLKMNAPEVIKSQVEMQEYESAEALRDVLKRFVQTRVHMSQPPGLAALPGAGKANSGGNTQPMDVDAIDKGWHKGGKNKGGKGKKGKKGGKDKDKGNKEGGTGKGKGGDRFDGWCNNCGKYGHRYRDCWHEKKAGKVQEVSPGNAAAGGAAKATGAGATVPKSVEAVSGTTYVAEYESYEDEGGWILMVDEDEEKHGETHLRGWTLILMDSGACTHVAPPSFAEDVPMEKAPFELTLRTASGSNMKIHGVRRVKMWARLQEGGAIMMTIAFVICGVARPIISVGNLLDKGVDVNFSLPTNSGSLRGPDGRLVELVRRGALFFLAVTRSLREALLMDSICPVVEEDGVVDVPADDIGVEVPMEKAGPEGPWDEARLAVEPGTPTLPSEAARRAHSLTHLPFAPWCRVCVEGRGQEAAHYKRHAQPSATPVLGADYCFFSSRAEELPVDMSTSLVLVCYNTSYLGAAVVPQKGVHPFAVKTVMSFIDETGYSRMMWQTDGEPAIVALMRAVRRELGKGEREPVEVQPQMAMRQSPKSSHQSNGVVEAAVKTLEGLVRTFCRALELNMNVKVLPDSPILGWIVRHAVFIQNRFMVKRNGRTAFEELRLAKFQAPLLEFGESVLGKDCTDHDSKLASSWRVGLWLGRSEHSGEHILGSSTGIAKCRTVKRRPEELKWDQTLYKAMVYTPWSKEEEKSARQQEEWTPTEGCKACEEEAAVGARRVGRPRAHTVACKQRQADFRKAREAGVAVPALLPPPAAAAAAPVAPGPAPGPSTPLRSGMEVDPANVPVPGTPVQESPRGVAREKAYPGGVGVTPEAKRGRVEPFGEKRDVAEPASSSASPAPVQLDKKGRIDAVMGLIAAIEPNEENDPLDEVEMPEVEPTEAEELEAKMEEIGRLVEYNAFTLVWPEARDVVLTLTWVKEFRSGKLKYRLCARPFGRKMPRSRDELYTPTPCMTSARALLVFAHRHGLSVRFFDVSRAFLHTPIRDRVLVRPPPEFGAEPGQAWLLNVVLYGLNEGMCDFDSHFENVVTGKLEDATKSKLHLKRLLSDSACYFDRARRLALLKHVDDGMIVAGEKESDKFIEELGEHFLLKPTGFLKVGEPAKFLGRWFERVQVGFDFWVDPALLKSLLAELGLTTCAGVPTPGVKAEQRKEGETPLYADEAVKFRTGVGKLQFIAGDRADCHYASKEAARSAKEPTKESMIRLKRAARYLRATEGIKQRMAPDSDEAEKLEVLVDSDWATDKVNRKSTTSVHIYYNGALIGSASKTQATVAQSSGEAEAYAVGSGAAVGLGVRSLLRELDLEPVLSLRSDSTAGISIQSRIGLGKLKHIHIKELFVQNLVRDGEIRIEKIRSEDNTSDLGTKHLPRADHERHRRGAGLIMSGDVCAIEEETSEARALGAARKIFAVCLAGLAKLALQGVALEGSCGHVVPFEPREKTTRAMEADTIAVVLTIVLMIVLMIIYAATRGRTKPTSNAAVQADLRWTSHEEASELLIEVVRAELEKLEMSKVGTKDVLVERLVRRRRQIEFGEEPPDLTRSAS